MVSLHDPLNDFPLRPEPPLDLASPSVEAASSVRSGSRDRASLPDRALGVAADVATSILVVLVALLAGVATRGRTPAFSGLGWAALFALYVSFFAIVVPLVLFGRTVGMALAGLIARDGETGRRLTPSEAVRRWAGTLATVAALGVPLFWTVRDAGAPTLADRLSGRTLVRDA
ncbi:MAG TPA: RDD family protein [Thermoanaerobaculia bacterium]